MHNAQLEAQKVGIDVKLYAIKMGKKIYIVWHCLRYGGKLLKTILIFLMILQVLQKIYSVTYLIFVIY